MPIASNWHVRPGARQGQRPRWPRGISTVQKKKLQPWFGCMSEQRSVFFCFFFVFFLPCLTLGWTCRSLAIGMFESGPYSRDPQCTPGGVVWKLQSLDYVIPPWQALNIPNFVFPNVLLTSRYWPTAITSLFSCLFPCFFFWLSLAPPWTCQLVPIGTFDLGSTWAEPQKKKGKKKEQKKEQKKHLFFP